MRTTTPSSWDRGSGWILTSWTATTPWREVLKHGTLSVGFIGLAETLMALTGKHHGESEESQKLGLEIVCLHAQAHGRQVPGDAA